MPLSARALWHSFNFVNSRMKIVNTSVAILLATLSVTHAMASVTVGGTRVVFDGTKKETSLSVENKDKVANLVQSWITPADAATPAKDALIITPPLFRLDAGDKNVLRIARSGLPMPEDHESMYWLNVKGIAAANENAASNSIQIAVNSRIKLIYRPAKLAGTYPEQQTQKLSWHMAGNKVVVNNPTPYYMNFATVKINGKSVESATWVGPNSDASFVLPVGIGDGKLTWRIYNDFGMAGDEHQSSI